MDDEIQMSISIPTDDEGYILLKCEHCGTFFKGNTCKMMACYIFFAPAAV